MSASHRLEKILANDLFISHHTLLYSSEVISLQPGNCLSKSAWKGLENSKYLTEILVICYHSFQLKNQSVIYLHIFSQHLTNTNYTCVVLSVRKEIM